LSEQWTITLRISRQKGALPRHFEDYPLQVDPDEYVLDAVERVWAFHDRSLTFRHACHHSTCGACGMLVNDVEKLTCITPIRSVTRDGGTLKVEPLRNFPVLSDLVVDMRNFYTRLEDAGFQQVSELEDAALPFERLPSVPGERLVDCIECGLCISACPVALTTPAYLGPGVLAGIQHAYGVTPAPILIAQADQEDGAWRCHSAFECSAVCPSNVDPAWRIMDLRRKTLAQRVRQFFQPGKQEKTS